MKLFCINIIFNKKLTKKMQVFLGPALKTFINKGYTISIFFASLSYFFMFLPILSIVEI